MRLAILVFVSCGLSACGSIARGTSEDVAINVTPNSADVRLSNGMQCQGSCVLDILRKQAFTVTGSAPGFKPQTVPVITRVRSSGGTALAGYIIAGGVIGLDVDAATGAALDHDPNPVVISLKPTGTTPRSAPGGRAPQARGVLVS